MLNNRASNCCAQNGEKSGKFVPVPDLIQRDFNSGLGKRASSAAVFMSSDSPSGARAALSFSEMTDVLDRAQNQLDDIGDEVDPVTAAELRARIARARELLELIAPKRRGKRREDKPPFWRNLSPDLGSEPRRH